MTINKALKVKNRLAGELSRLLEIAKRENSRRSDSTSTVDVEKVFGMIQEVRLKIATSKGELSIASAPIAAKLAELSELKTYINWLNGLPVREGQELVAIGQKEVKEYTWTAFYNRQKLDGLLKDYQIIISNLQDEIDEFNAITKVNIDF